MNQPRKFPFEGRSMTLKEIVEAYYPTVHPNTLYGRLRRSRATDCRQLDAWMAGDRTASPAEPPPLLNTRDVVRAATVRVTGKKCCAWCGVYRPIQEITHNVGSDGRKRPCCVICNEKRKARESARHR